MCKDEIVRKSRERELSKGPGVGLVSLGNKQEPAGIYNCDSYMPDGMFLGQGQFLQRQSSSIFSFLW